MLLDYLGLTPSVNQVSPLPWTPSLTPKRRDEKIRPIFWANRAKSYVNRTETWDEFPNGRWGDARSPAYGDVDAYGVKLRYSNDEAKEMWGTPSRRRRQGALPAILRRPDQGAPWSETPVARETSVISEKLTKMNQLGFLTINSQPAVDGARSDDKVHGWGPKNGYVYQKAYLEFFVSPEDLDALIARIEADVQITYHAVNAQGDMRTNTNSEARPTPSPGASFPHCEIIQPTIVESISFLAWKDEAYEIGRNWAKCTSRRRPLASSSRPCLTTTSS